MAAIQRGNHDFYRKGVALSRDKVVQEVIHLILEAIYDSPYGPSFCDTSHGFRPTRSCHTALRELRGKWAAVNWFIEGDLHACFDTIDQTVLVTLLRKKVTDERFLRLIWKLLRAGYLDLQGARKDSLAGTPQGALASPILANVVLHELDLKVEELRQRLEQGKKKRRNPLHRRLSARKQALRKRGETATREFRDLVKQIRAIPAVEVNDADFIRVKYLRYADDWIIGVCGPHALAEQIKAELKQFLADHLHVTLSEAKTHITNGRTGQATFLGTLISIGRGGEQRVVTTTNGSGKAIKRRSTGWEPVMNAPIHSLIQRLHRRGICTTVGESTTKLGWTNLDTAQIIGLYNGINRGILNYYRFVDNIDSLARIQYILQYSLARTLAAKFKISVKQVFRRFGGTITVTVKAMDGKPDRHVSFHLNRDWTKQRNAFALRDRHVDLVQTALRMRTRSKLGKPCCICGTQEQVEMHHLRHIRKMGHKPATGFSAIMRALNRKQIPTCHTCHQKIHRGEYDGLRLSDFAHDPH